MGTVNVNKLKGKLTELGMTVTDLANLIGYDKSALYRRIKNNGASLTIDEANAIIRVLKLTKDEAIAIFFSQLVA